MKQMKRDYKHRAKYPLVPDEINYTSGLVTGVVIVAGILKLAGVI